MSEAITERRRAAGGLRASLAGAACLGPWGCDPSTGRFTLTADLAARLAHGGRGGTIALDAFLLRVHACDRMRIESVLQAAAGTGGLFETEFRSSARAGPAWLRLMGRADPVAQDRPTVLRGLAFDLTEARLQPGPAAGRAQRQANHLADLVVAMQGIVPNLHNPSVAEPFEALKRAVGIELARHLRSAAGPHPH